MLDVPVLEAARFLTEALAKLNLRHVVIGGVALQFWGQPRFTRDLDATLLVDFGSERSTAQALLQIMTARIPDCLEFALQNRILLLKAPNGCDIDLSFGIPGFETQIYERGREMKIRDFSIRICSAEDLVILKALAGRPRDQEDILGVIRRLPHLDIPYIQNGWPNSLSCWKIRLAPRFSRRYSRAPPPKSEFSPVARQLTVIRGRSYLPPTRRRG